VNKRKLFVHVLTVFVLLVTCSSLAHAQATRTWVSGVGDDANPCSRTAPCKTFAGAISKTAPGGEINVLDPGGFGAVTITKSITISSEGFEAGVLVSGTNGIIVSAGVADVVILRGLHIQGLGTGLDGIKVLGTLAALHVEKCTIDAFRGSNGSAIEIATTSGTTQVFIKDTIVRDNGQGTGGGIFFNSAGGTVKASLDNVRMENNTFGLKAAGTSTVSVSNSVAAGNSNAGFSVVGGSAELNITRSVAANNLTGLVCSNGTLRIGNSSITGNGTAVATAGSNCFTDKGNTSNAIIAPPLLNDSNPQ
jgi:hypothetical protein